MQVAPETFHSWLIPVATVLYCLAALCGAAGVALAGLLGFAAAVTPAWKSASMDPQTAITQGEVN